MGNKYYDDDGNLLYEEGKGGNLSLFIVKGTGSLLMGNPSNVEISINQVGLTSLGKDNLLLVAKLKLETIGYCELILTEVDHVTPAEDWGRKK